MPMASDAPQVEEWFAIQLARQGDSQAFRRLVELYDRRLLYFVRRILGESDGALDVMQAVWLTVYRKLRNLRSAATFRVWVYRIAHDQAVSELRRKARRPVLLADADIEPPADALVEHEEAVEDAARIHAALPDLSVDHRRVLTLRFMEGMSIEEIAEVVGCSAGTVKSRLHYAKAALRRRMEELRDG